MHRFIAILFVTAGFLPAAVEPARTAMSVVDSLGVNTHLGYGDTVYGSAYEQVVKPKLLALGVRHIRDSAQNGAVGQKYRELFDAGEIRVLEICDPRLDWMANPTTETMRQIANACGPALEAMEGPNEYDGGKDWITVLRSFCTRLYQAAKAEPLTAKFPVLAPSLIQPGNYSQLGDCSEFVDGSNLHHYMGGHHPGTGGWGDDHYGSLEWILRTCAKRQAPAKPVYVTECGFHSAIKQSQGGHNPTSELASGAYTIRQWLGNVQAGIVRSYLYEFIDSSVDPDFVNLEANFGLLRHDGTEKPAYRVLREVLNELRDPGPTFTPGKFNCEITGQDNDTRHLVIQKRDGTAYVLLWREVESWDANHRLDLPIAPLPVSLSLIASAAEATVVTFDAQGAANRRKVNCTNGQVRLVLTEQVTLVRFDGRQARVVVQTPAAAPLLAVAPETRAAWDVKLYKRLRDGVATNRKPRFHLTLVDSQVEVTAADEAGAMTVHYGDSNLSYDWKRVSDHDRSDLAVNLLRDDVESDRLLVAFYAYLIGKPTLADQHLAHVAQADADQVRELFRGPSKLNPPQ